MLTEQRRDYLINEITKTVIQLNPSLDLLGYYQPGFVDTFFWKYSKLILLSDETLQELFDHRKDKFGIDLSKITITYLPNE